MVLIEFRFFKNRTSDTGMKVIASAVGEVSHCIYS